MPLGRFRKTRCNGMNGTHQLLAYADDVNIHKCNMNTTRNIETLIDNSGEVGI
jgi:hypothetical protein